METADVGETLPFGAMSDGAATVLRSDASPALRTATLRTRTDSLGTAALFSHADGSYSAAISTLKFTASGAEVIHLGVRRRGHAQRGPGAARSVRRPY